MQKTLSCFLLAIFLNCCTLLAQTPRIDQLRKEVYSEHGKQRYTALLQLLEHRYSVSPDSVSRYFDMAMQLGGDTLSTEIRLMLGMVQLMIDGRKASPEILISRADSVLRFIRDEELQTDYGLRYLQYKAVMLVRTGKYKEALSDFYEVLRLAEKRNNIEYICAGWNGIGWVHMEMEKYREAVSFFQRGINLVNDTAYMGRPNILYNNLASCYHSLHMYDSALKYISIAEKNIRIVGNLSLLANSLAIKSDILKQTGRPEQVASCLSEMVDIRKKVGDVFFIVSDMILLARFYAEKKECTKGVQVCMEALELMRRYQLRSKELSLYEALAQNYKSCGDYKLYAEQLQLIMSLKDSISKNTSAEALAEMQTKYELKKKEEQIVRKDLLLSRRNYLVFGSLALLMMAGLAGGLYIRMYRQRSATVALIEINNAREEERKRIAAELHDNIGTQLSFIARKIELLKSDAQNTHSNYQSGLENISSASRRTIGDLRETIWALNKDQIDLRELADRLKLFLRKQFDDLKEVRLDIVEQIHHSVSLSSAESLSIFRIVQEAIHNAAHHADATMVSLHITSSSGKSWSIEVSDNGKGFDVHKVYEDHYGLVNMKERAATSGLDLEIQSEPRIGTRVRLGKSD
jgi:signal transduction histidine kinase